MIFNAMTGRTKEWYTSGATFSWGQNEVFYKQVGSGPTMLLIHGFPTAGVDWIDVAEELSKHFTLVIPDLLDYGQSLNKNAKRYSILDQVDMLEDLLIFLGVNAVHVLAHDVGDTVAQEILARDVDDELKVSLESCVLLNGGLLPAEHRAKNIQKWLLSPVGPLVARFMNGKKFMNVVASIFGKDTRPDEQECEKLWNISVGVNGKSSFARRIHYMTDRLNNEDRWVSALGRSKVQLRLINGTADPVSGGHAADAIQKLFPAIEVIRLEGIGHFPPIEAPADVAKYVLDYHGVS